MVYTSVLSVKKTIQKMIWENVKNIKKVLKENSDNFHNMFSFKIGFYSLHPYNHFDVQCDFECEYLAEKNISSICSHALSRCEICKRCWDGFAQCPCLIQYSEC